MSCPQVHRLSALDLVLTLHSWQDQNQRTSAFSRILKPETFLHSSKRKANQPKSIPKPSKTQSRAQRCSDSHLVRQILPLFLSVYASCSTLLQDLSSSEFADAHLLRILDGFAPSTVFKYLSALISFANTVHWLHFSALDLTEITLADALHAHSSELGKFSQMTLKAIRWSWKNLQLSCFSSSTSSLINSFTKEIVIRSPRVFDFSFDRSDPVGKTHTHESGLGLRNHSAR